MKEFRKYIWLLLSIFFFLVAAIWEHQFLYHQARKNLIENFQSTLHQQEEKLSFYLDAEEKKINEGHITGNYAADFANLNKLYDNEGLGFLIFNHQQMVYWSSNHVTFPNILSQFSGSNGLLVLPGGVFCAYKRVIGSYELIGLVLLKNNFSYENQFLENKFIPPFSLPSTFQLIPEKQKNSVEINDQANQYLFSVATQEQLVFNESQLYFPVFLYLIGFIFLLLTIYHKMEEYREENFVFKMLVLLVVLFVIYWFHLLFDLPAILSHFETFGAKYYAYTSWIPSLGDFFILTTLFFFWSIVFVHELTKHHSIPKVMRFPALVFVALLYQIMGVLIGNLIGNSNVTYKLNQITDIDQYSISSYLAIAMLLFSVFLINLKILEKTERMFNRRLFLRIHLIALIVSVALSIWLNFSELYLFTLFLAVNYLQTRFRNLRINNFSFSYAILFISLFSIASLLVVYKTIALRDIQVLKLRAVNLSSEQDPVAEVFLSKIQNQINTDGIIPQLISSTDELVSYLDRNYFDGYFRKYDIQYTFCTGTQNLYIEDENREVPCFPYFEQKIAESGTKIPGTGFYFMNKMNGRVSYLGVIHYPLAEDSKGFSIFIELISKIASEGIGFPELLMERSLIKPFRYKYLSHAKYFEGELVSQSGDYAYNLYLQSYELENLQSEFELRSWDGYDHLIYTIDDNNSIIVSSKTVKLIDYLISFPYIFVFYFVFAMVVTMIGNPNFRKMIIPRDLRFRIQIAIISVVLISLLFVAAGTIYYNIQEYKKRHQVDLQEKLQSISEEIDSRLGTLNSITPELQQWLYAELYNLSNIFRTDINIYKVNGELLASSRPEIFRKGITSERINAEAFYQLSEKYQLNYFQPEKIGNLSYLSAYKPILNSSGDFLGYLNLPYFTREDELKQGISTFIVAFINLYLILFLTSVIVAVFLSNQITLPLSLIREKLKSIQLGKKNEQINYKAEDEIGALVKEYNHKVEELAESASLLAKSERESAWREMAKQIAHEIKNPLTPMKLNIQYLQRAKAEGKEQYNDFFDRVTQNLIEQIDTLSGIATEFSTFAQIPKTKNEVFDLIEVLRNVMNLFESNENLNLSLRIGKLKEIKIFADKEQLSRVFLNLIKNAIQSIPPERKGEIVLLVQLSDHTVVAGVSDNGSGISEEVQQHLFEPNFTTKTSGMGLGLSIVQNMINNFNGKIWYETSATSGTTFFVEIPLHHS